MRVMAPILIVVVVVLLTVLNTAFIVRQDQQAIVLRFGQWTRSINAPGTNEAGIKFKIPGVDSVVIYSRRNLGLPMADLPAIVASDQERLEVDAFVRWRILNPRTFYQSAQNQRGGEARLRAFTEDALRNILGAATTNDIISGRRAALMQAIEDHLNRSVAPELGIRIVDVRIRQADLPQATRDSVYQRMATERQQEAGRYRAEGAEQAQRITADADRQVTVIRATAREASERTKGEGDALRARIFARAYGRDPEFAAFYRSMLAYQTALDAGTPIIVPADSDFFRYMRNRTGSGR